MPKRRPAPDQPELQLAKVEPPPPPAPPPALRHVDGLFENWFIDYASYVILDRAVPHIDDGLKPVQRRIMHSLWELEDGRYNKVANTVGNTMKYHPHGDVSITDALVGLGQKELLIDTQGNWGNIITGDPAAAPRYIEARLSKFALEAVFSPKITTWTKSYDERNDEPVTLPIKFPLLLAQGVEGIAVGLSCKVLPHNFNEIIDASIAILRGRKATLLPDFLTGGLADCTDYQDGRRGGKVRVRARIEVRSPNLLAITEIPFGTVVPNLIASIVAAHQKEKIKIKKVDDNTSEKAEVLIHLQPGSDPEQIKNALYAFTECEILIHPNAVVIFDKKPSFTSVSDILRISTERTRELLRRELEIRLGELNARWHLLSLEKIFIEKKVYQQIENCETWESVLDTISKGLRPYIKHLKEPVTLEDCARLTEIKIKRISRYDSRSADDDLKKIAESIKETNGHLANLTGYAVAWFQGLKKKYGKGRERRTEITTFTAISAASVAHANVRPFVNRKEGFIGWGLKRDEAAEPLGECSDLDEVMAISRDGSLKVNRVAEKDFFGADLQHATLFQRGDSATTYNVLYVHKENGGTFAKRFHMGEGVIRDRVYPIAQGKIVYLGVARTPDDAPKVMITLKDGQGARKRELDFDFATLVVKGRSSLGNRVTKYKVQKVARVKE
jgi:topoisomerase-4 subunit A